MYLARCDAGTTSGFAIQLICSYVLQRTMVRTKVTSWPILINSEQFCNVITAMCILGDVPYSFKCTYYIKVNTIYDNGVIILS